MSWIPAPPQGCIVEPLLVPASEFRWLPSDPWVNQRTVDAAEMDALRQRNAQQETTIAKLQERIRQLEDNAHASAKLYADRWERLCEAEEEIDYHQATIREVADLVGWEPEPEDYDDDDGDDPWPTLADEVQRSIAEVAHRERQKTNEREFEAGRQQGRKEMNRLGDDEKKTLENTIAALNNRVTYETKRAAEGQQAKYDLAQLKRIFGVK